MTRGAHGDRHDERYRDRPGRGAEFRPDPGWRVRELVLRLAVEAFGASAVQEPVEGFSVLTRTRLDEPLAGVRAARLVSDVAAGALREWALTKRGAGSSWADVADALNLRHEHPDSSAAELAEVAWEWLIEHQPPAPRARGLNAPGGGGCPASAVWTCTSCQARVRDTGPYEPHPADREQGHRPACRRHAAEIATWRREVRWDDEQHDEPDHEQDDDEQDERGSETRGAAW